MKVKTGVLAGQGLGDSVADLTQLSGIDRIAKLYEQTTGKSCGCEERQDSLNKLFPFGNTFSA